MGLAMSLALSDAQINHILLTTRPLQPPARTVDSHSPGFHIHHLRRKLARHAAR
jgi:hypothetical protein